MPYRALNGRNREANGRRLPFREQCADLAQWLFEVAICNRHTEYRLGLLGWFDFVGLIGFRRIVVAPQPDHLRREFSRPVAGIVRAFAETKMEVVALELQRVGKAEVGQRPAAPTVMFDVFGAVLQPNPNITLGLAQDLIWIVLAAVLHVWIFPPLDAGETTDPRNHAAELIGHLPGRVEGADATRREAGDRAAVSILADVVLGGDPSEHFIAKIANVAVAYSVIQGAAHGILEGALPFVRVGLRKSIGWSAWRAGDIARVDEDADHDGNLFLSNQVIDDVERGIVAIAVDVPAAVLEDHKRGGSVLAVLRGDVNPVFALYAISDLSTV